VKPLARICLLLCLLGAMSAASTIAQSQEQVGSNQTLKNLVDIGGGRHINFMCSGKGSPTIVFLQALGAAIPNWRKVRDPAAAITRTCLYDRAGFGYSDPSSLPSTADNMVDDLHTVLHAAGITGRVVLVGHSLGGLVATLYTDKFEPQVAGLVLVDPSFFDQFSYSLSQQSKDAITAGNNQFLALLQACKSLAAEHKLSKTDSHNCFKFPQNPTPAEAQYFEHQDTSPDYYASGISESENFNPSNDWTSIDGTEEMRQQRRFGSIPLEVLTRSIFVHDAQMSDTENKASEDYWKLGHDKLAARSTRGESIVIPQSSHQIQGDQPQSVVEAIRKVVLEVRQADMHYAQRRRGHRIKQE
jgi:pimeloyl-ACP methyl ester carboxylesterase